MTEHIYKRLDELGEEQVRHLMATAGLPESWRPHILQWMEAKQRERSTSSNTNTNNPGPVNS